MSRTFIITTVLLSFIGIIVRIGLFGLFEGFSGIFEMLFFGFLTACILFLISGKTRKNFSLSFLRSSLFFGSLIGSFSLFILLFIGFYTLFPTSLSQITLSNGKKTLVFFQMSHIATQRFYDDVHRDMLSLTQSGYTIYFEGVGSGTEESKKAFSELLGIKLDKDTYSQIAPFLGMVAQNDTLFSSIDRSALRNVDLSLDDIVGLASSGSRDHAIEDPLDVVLQLDQYESSKSRPLFRALGKALLNFSLKASQRIDIGAMTKESMFFHTLIEKRNSFVIDTFLQSGESRVVLLYGALHFPGMYASLRSHDPSWDIVSIRSYYPYR